MAERNASSVRPLLMNVLGTQSHKPACTTIPLFFACLPFRYLSSLDRVLFFAPPRSSINQTNRAAWSTSLLPLSSTPSPSSGLASNSGRTSGSASGSASGSTTPSPLPAGGAAAGGGGGAAGVGTGLGHSWVSQLRAGSPGAPSGGGNPGSAPPRMVDLLTGDGREAEAPPAGSPFAADVFGGFPSLASAAAAPAEAAPVSATAAVGSPGQVGCAHRDRGASRSTAPSTPLPAAKESPPPTEELKEGDSIEAQFLLADQAVWTTSWYRGKVSRVNRAGADGGEGGNGVTYGVEFVDGDCLDDVPEGHIRLFRGLQVGSVVTVEWPSKGGRPFKGCLTRVCAGEDGNPPTVSVIYEDTDTEVGAKLTGIRDNLSLSVSHSLCFSMYSLRRKFSVANSPRISSLLFYVLLCTLSKFRSSLPRFPVSRMPTEQCASRAPMPR